MNKAYKYRIYPNAVQREFFAKTFDELTTTELYEILKSRAQIFMIEQKIYCLDMDDIDYKAMHFFLKENEAYLHNVMQKEFNSEYSEIRYFTAILKNNLTDFKQKSQ